MIASSNIPKSELLGQIRHGIIGSKADIMTAFGRRALTYADYTASGRSLDFIEEVIRQQVLPFYANTHTEANATGQQTTAFREQARELIRQSVNATQDDHLVLFCGSGATGAINVLISQLGLRELSESDKDKVCVLIGPYEHHSNELPWRELGVKVVRIPETEKGGVCLLSLKKQLVENQERQLIGSFSASSNVTGILCDQDAITVLLHEYQALAIWDFAAGAPYLELDMAPLDKMAHKDAMFFSTHKFIGGPSTPGVLIVRKDIIVNHKPSVIGGGTVSFVAPNTHRFLPVGERREEGGTPNIIDSIRAGLVFQLKQQVSSKWIEERESELVCLINERWNGRENIERLGHPTADRLSITAFRIKTQQGYLHHGFVTALLNDLFGIQVRGGCSCAGPYGHQLLGLDTATSERIQEALLAGEKLVKPGWVRFNLNYFIEDEEAHFILDAIDFVIDHGVKILPYYSYDQDADLWRFQNTTIKPTMLTDLVWQDVAKQEALESDKKQYFNDAFQILDSLELDQYSIQTQAFNDEYSDIRDFVLVRDLLEIEG